MNVYEYLTVCDEQDDTTEMISTWLALGKTYAKNDTKAYRNGQLLIVDAPGSKLNGLMFYVLSDYFEPIDWNTASVIDLQGHTVVKDGVTSQVVQCVSTLQFEPADILTVEGSPEYKAFKPFEKYKSKLNTPESDAVIIDEDELNMCLIPLGVPFVTMDELEYSRSQILRLAIWPTLKSYFKNWPIIREEQKSLAAGERFSIKFPENAYGAIIWSSSGYGTLGGSQMMSAIGFFASETPITGYGAAGSGIRGKRRRLSYRKSVPGYKGGWGAGSGLDTMLDTLALRSTMKNVFTRERYDRIRKEDGIYAEGYCTGGNCLNIMWLCQSHNWDDVATEEYDDVVLLAQANAVKLFSGVRTATKPDGNVALNAKELQDSWNAVRKEVLQKWEDSPFNKTYTPQRGANAF